MTRLTKGKTTLLIAHRFSSIRLANRIIVMDKGLVVADGSHEKFIQNMIFVISFKPTTGFQKSVKSA